MSVPPKPVTVDLDVVESASSRAQRLLFPETLPSKIIETGLGAVSAVLNWIWFLLILIIVSTVAMRYVIVGNTVWIEEVQWHLYSIGFMFGIGYALTHDAHVRVDVLATNFRPSVRAWIEFLMIVVIILPMCWLIITFASSFVEASYRRGERSSAPGGLTHRWMIKGVIVLAFAYIGLAAFARLTRVSSYLFNFPRARDAR